MTSGPIRIIFYDLDGTLVDAFADIAAALNYGLRSVGLPERTLAETKSFVGNGIVKLIERGVGPAHLDRVDDVLPLVGRYYQENPAKLSCVYPGVLKTLDRVKSLGIRQVVLTNKPHTIAVQTCTNMDITPYVDDVQGESPDQPLKPDPETARVFLRKYRLNPSDALMVGDGGPDVELARAAGMRMVGVAWGMHTADEMRALGAEIVISKMEELFNVLSVD